MSSITDDVVRFTTTSPGTRASAASTASASTSSLSSTRPVSSPTARRSPSGSCAKPISQPLAPHQFGKSPSVSGPRFGHARERLGGVHRNRLQLAAERLAEEPARSSREPAPFTPSSATRNRRARIRSTSTCFSTRSMCSRAGVSYSRHDAADLLVGRLPELALVVQVEQFAALVVIEEQALRR